MTEAPDNTRVSRRLAAILAADIAGYSALMGADEARTVRDLKAHQSVILPMISDHGGRIIDTAGDGILAEFASVVNAVECALAMQKIMAGHNADVEEPRRMRYRIAVNLGDVIHDDQRVYGDGVNIAARMEALADPGGVCLSATAYEHVHKKLSHHFTDLGEQQLKNIAEPIRVYRIEPGPVAQAKPALTIPDKPSIAVLPFTNLSGDPKEDYFSDGITEDIITELSRFSELFVIARNSSFQYKGKSPDIRQVGRELGVRYVLEGSIRRAGDRVRITAQLTDATSGAHRWAERYDRELKDIFAVQDEVARTIAGLLAAHVKRAEIERSRLTPSSTWQAYDYYLRAVDTYNSFLSSWDVAELYEVTTLLEKCRTFDPNYARAHTFLSTTLMDIWINRLDKDYLSDDVRERAYQVARRAVELDPSLPEVHAQLAWVLAYKREPDAAMAALDKSMRVNPNYIDFRFATVLIVAGQASRAVALLETYMRRDPFYPPLIPGWLGFAYYMQKKYTEAIVPLRERVVAHRISAPVISGWPRLTLDWVDLTKPE